MNSDSVTGVSVSGPTSPARVAEVSRTESLLFEISTRFIDLPAEQLEAQILDAQRRVSERLGLDRSTLWQQPPNRPDTFLLTHCYQSEGLPALPASANAQDFVPWTCEQVRRGRTVVLASLDQLPPEAARDRQSFEQFGTRSTLVAPLSVGGAVAGALSFATTRAPREWPPQLVKELTLLAQVFANVIARDAGDRALRQAANEWRATFDSIGDVILLLDDERRAVRANAAAATALGRPLEQLIGQPCYALMHGSSTPIEACPFERAMASGAGQRVEVLDARHGCCRAYSVFPMVGRAESRVAGICVSEDVTALRQMERDLLESRERLALAAVAENDGLWDWTIASDEAYFSRQWKHMLGYAEHEAPATRAAWEALVHPDDRERASGALRDLVAGRSSTLELEHRLRHRDGDYRWVLWRGKVLVDGAGQPYRVAGSHTDITARKLAEEQLRQSLDEVSRLRDQLQQQNVYLRQEVKSRDKHARIIGDSAAIGSVLAQVERVAATSATVLLLGETGTGKELIATEIHEFSSRRQRVMVRVNCSAIPVTLIESELFGREKGAYTGALSKQIGRFELAHGSTLFLDEIGELPPEIQVKLLRVLQERQFERLGSPKPITVDVRVIAATNRDLEKLVQEGKFRQDLYYRLNVFPITVPPLRERREDIPALVSSLVSEFGTAFGKSIESIAPQSMAALQAYHWPGNVRELRNVIERAMIMASDSRLTVELPGPVGLAQPADFSARAIERAHIVRVLESTAGRIRGKHGAAAILQLKPTTLESRMAKLGIPTRGKRPTPR